MTLEIQLYNLVKTLGYPVSWTHKDLNKQDTTLPFIVINFLSDTVNLYLDGSQGYKSGRIAFTIYSKKLSESFQIKESLRTLLINADDFNFSENAGFTDFEDSVYAYQLDFSYFFNGTE